MKFNKLGLFISLISMVFILNACGREEFVGLLPNTLPPYTQEGKNIVACKINNQVWVNGGLRKKGLAIELNPTVRFQTTEIRNQKTTHLYVSAYRYSEQSTNNGYLLDFSIGNFKGVGGYPILSAYSENSAGLIGFYDFLDTIVNSDKINVQGMIEVRHWDKDKKIVAGTFEYNVYIPGDTVKVREGRFDVRY